jgi:hypothetical protein
MFFIIRFFQTLSTEHRKQMHQTAWSIGLRVPRGGTLIKPLIVAIETLGGLPLVAKRLARAFPEPAKALQRVAKAFP